MRKEKAEKHELFEVLKDVEAQIKREAQTILLAKECKIHQQSMNLLLEWFAISKKTYDDLKRRYEAYGK